MKYQSNRCVHCSSNVSNVFFILIFFFLNYNTFHCLHCTPVWCSIFAQCLYDRTRFLFLMHWWPARAVRGPRSSRNRKGKGIIFLGINMLYWFVRIIVYISIGMCILCSTAWHTFRVEKVAEICVCILYRLTKALFWTKFFFINIFQPAEHLSFTSLVKYVALF